MRDPSLPPAPPEERADRFEPESVRRLLTALGKWGVAEATGAPEPELEQLADQALDAYKDVAAVA